MSSASSPEERMPGEFEGCAEDSYIAAGLPVVAAGERGSGDGFGLVVVGPAAFGQFPGWVDGGKARGLRFAVGRYVGMLEPDALEAGRHRAH